MTHGAVQSPKGFSHSPYIKQPVFFWRPAEREETRMIGNQSKVVP